MVAQASEAGVGIKSKIAELFNVSEVNPESQNLGPNEVSQQTIDRITPNASSFDKAAPGARSHLGLQSNRRTNQAEGLPDGALCVRESGLVGACERLSGLTEDQTTHARDWSCHCCSEPLLHQTCKLCLSILLRYCRPHALMSRVPQDSIFVVGPC